MKAGTVVGAVIGSLVGVAIWYFLETARPPRDATWAPLLIGVLTGLGSRILGSSSPSSILKGAVTAAIAIGAMVAARQGITYAITQQSLQNQEPVLKDAMESDSEPTESAPAEDEAGESAETPLALEPADTSRIPSAATSAQKVAMRGQAGTFAAYFAVGALVAYFLGKGKGTCCCAAPPARPADTSDGPDAA